MDLLKFRWICEGEFAISARPQGLSDLLWLRQSGIGAVVSVTMSTLSPSEFDECGLAWLHLPVEDFTAPTLKQIQTFADFVDDQRTLGHATLVHCSAGLGRSGTMAACHLVARGLDAQQALDEVRSLRSGAVETEEQERAIHTWAEHLRSRSAEPE
jgi:atypical dual specificity phosphatase